MSDFYDVITYCEDTEALVQEVMEKYPKKIFIDEKTGNVTFAIDKTPTVRNGNKTLTLVRCPSAIYDMLASLESIEILGTYEDVFADEEKHAKYKEVYPYDVPIKYTDPETGEEVEYYRPQKFGVFA